LGERKTGKELYSNKNLIKNLLLFNIDLFQNTHTRVLTILLFSFCYTIRENLIYYI